MELTRRKFHEAKRGVLIHSRLRFVGIFSTNVRPGAEVSTVRFRWAPLKGGPVTFENGLGYRYVRQLVRSRLSHCLDVSHSTPVFHGPRCYSYSRKSLAIPCTASVFAGQSLNQVVSTRRCFLPRTPKHRSNLDPHHHDDNIHALAIAALVLVAPHAIRFIVPESTRGAVHAAATHVWLPVRRRRRGRAAL